MKICQTCLEEKPFSAFHKDRHRKDGLCPQCKSCRAKYKKENPENKATVLARASRPENRAKRKTYSRERYRRQEIKSHYKNLKFQKTYGITLHDYETIKRKQKHRCAICLRHEKELTQALHVDHCHETGKVRGLLCGSCNLGIGKFKDSTALLENAILYLRQE